MGSFWRGGGRGKERAVRRVWQGLGRVGEGGQEGRRGCQNDLILVAAVALLLRH